ncbi:hypothetical protein SAMN04489735_10649 [Aneurinibacillus thermoaerophilus]|uniref:Helix-turn-helix domain-containing protein n=3 Tax=Aneurinibacillus group TaxID=85151 RepID=A0A1G8FES1_ANETH|nr:hypothetical protein SAMN04489735_10649 [Aneurinibacillus thermoaerophilus]
MGWRNIYSSMVRFKYLEGDTMAEEITFKSRDELTAYIVNEVVNTTEALEILGCSRQNLNDLVKRGVLKPIKELPRDRLFYKADVLKRKEQAEQRKKQ